MSAPELLGDAFMSSAPWRAMLTADVSHGVLAFDSDGSFTYRPGVGYVGVDSFRYVLTRDGQTSGSVAVTIAIGGGDGPSPDPQAVFAIGSTGAGGPDSPDVTFGSLGPLSFSFAWLIPSLVVSVPGLLVLVVIGVQLLGGGVWLPFVRRDVGDFGLGSRRRGRGPA